MELHKDLLARIRRDVKTTGLPVLLNGCRSRGIPCMVVDAHGAVLAQVSEWTCLADAWDRLRAAGSPRWGKTRWVRLAGTGSVSIPLILGTVGAALVFVGADLPLFVRL